jgi:fructan beta-fructosidase
MSNHHSGSAVALHAGRFVGAVLLALLAAGAAREADAADDIVIADFEGKDYGEWKAEGEAFGSSPAQGTLPRQMQVSGFEGKGLANSFNGGDDATGTLTSPPFVVSRKFINFLIGGGKHSGKACMNLLVDGKIVRTATGPNDRPGGTERLDWASWDVADLAGRSAVIQIVDNQTGGWGHINVDQITQSDTPRRSGPARCEIRISKPYLHLPVQTGARKARMVFLVADNTVREFEIELAEGEPDFLVFADVRSFIGQTVTVAVDALRDGSKALDAIVQADDVPGADAMYTEALRPQFHFSSRRGWLNDPNGLVYHRGEYHLYYQHNPYGWAWGNMHWGHAVSTDLVRWTELPVAIYPHRFGDWVFSGSAVIDAADTAGFRTGDEDVLVAAYTSTGRGECIAFSGDRGRTFTDFDGNPVVKHGGRDPKVIWYAPGRHWVMAVYDERQGSKGIAFHTSPDLKAWTFAGRIDGYFECPELFEAPLAGEPGESRWVVYAADGAYAVGAFDGKTFTPEHEGKHRLNYGNAFYASQTYSNIPAADGRRIQVAWGRVATPGMPFNQCMLFPVSLTLHRTPEGPRLIALPVREIETLYARTHAFKVAPLAEGANPLENVRGELFDVDAEFAVGDAAQVGLLVRGLPVTVDVKAGQVECHGCKAPLPVEGGKVRLRVLVDRTTVEVFAAGGRVYMPVGYLAPAEDRTLAAFARGGAARATLTVRELKSAWR